MNILQLVTYFLLISIIQCDFIIVPSLAIVGLGTAKYFNLDKKFMRFMKCRPSFEMNDFRDDLRARVYGQHLLETFLINSLKNHFSSDTPNRALSLIFVGSTGTGKNYVSSIIAKNVFKNERGVENVHFFSGRIEFPLDSEISSYKQKIVDEVRNGVVECSRAIFIFDEIDKVPRGIVDVIKPFLDHHAVIDGVDYRLATFIFLTNKGSLKINGHYRRLKEQGKKREEMTYTDFESILRNELFNDDGMFAECDIIANHLVTAYLPFLPLEKAHVAQCIKYELQNAMEITPTTENVNKVMDYIEFYNGEYSKAGCRRVSDFVRLVF